MAATYEKVVKRVNEVNESVLAELIERDVQQLTERALDQGVTAYLERPVHRVRPNERFLQATIRNVAGSNRREQEAQLWEAHRSHQRLLNYRRLGSGQREIRLPSGGSEYMQQQQHASSGARHRRRRRDDADKSSGPTDCSNSESSGAGSVPSSSHGNTCQDGGMGIHEMEAMLGARRVKGRGAVGSRAEEPGPYLPRSYVTPGLHDECRDDGPAAPRRLLGPAAPEWLRQRNTVAGTADEAALPSAVEIVRGAKRNKRKFKHKAKSDESSKQKTKKRKKHKSDACKL